MKFVHFGDTHLGRRNFNLSEREQDFKSSFKQVIDFCIGEGIDFVVHSGDIVDTGRPRYSTINFLISQLKRLSKKGIPFFTIAGSHDVAPDGTVLSVLDKVGLLTNLSSKRYYENREEGIVLKGETYKGIFLAGVPGRRANIEDIYKNLVPEMPKSKFSILLFHHTISDITPKFADIPKSVLPKGFDYYAGGHWHERYMAEFMGKPIVYPGSTEACDVKEISQRGFYFVEDEKINWIALKTRKFLEKKVDCDDESPQELEKKIISCIGDGDGAILLLRLYGKLKSGSKSEIDRIKILETAIGKGYLHAVVYLGELKNPNEEFVKIENKSLEEIELDYFKSQKYSEWEIRIATDLLRSFGERVGEAEVDRKIKQAISMLEKEYENK